MSGSAWNANGREARRDVGLTAAALGASGGEIVMVSLLPLVLEPRVPSAAWIGALMAAEGFFAILVPYVIGALSDRLPTGLADRFGRRAFFLLAMAPIMAACLALIPFGGRLWLAVVLLFVFFAALHAFMTPLFALVIESVSYRRWGRVYGVFGAMRAGGIAYGLVAGGFLFSLWRPSPFLVAAVLVLGTTAVSYAARRNRQDRRRPKQHVSRDEHAFWRELADRPGVRWLLAANALATAAIDGVRPYVFLFATTVLGLTVARSSLLLLFLLVGVAAGSLLIGWLGDRIGRGRLLLIGALVTGTALAFGFLVRSPASAILLMVPAGLGAATFATLPYPVFAEFTEVSTMGRDTGVFRISIGAARLVAPLVVGLVIDWGATIDPELGGYPFIWPVAALFALLSAAALWYANRRAGGRIL